MEVFRNYSILRRLIASYELMHILHSQRFCADRSRAKPLAKHAKACFKRRATAVLRWLDCWTAARHTSTSWFNTSNLIQSNRMTVAENKPQKQRNCLANF